MDCQISAIAILITLPPVVGKTASVSITTALKNDFCEEDSFSRVRQQEPFVLYVQ